jgi:hypothetical protein
MEMAAQVADGERRATVADEGGASDEEGEYGLKDLARLPLLEQVHRLFHAIQQRYPYKEVGGLACGALRSLWCVDGTDDGAGRQTNAWNTLPLDQKKRMLDYIRDRRTRKPPASEAGEGVTPTPDGASEPAPTTTAEPPATAKADPYLQMLQRRTLRSAPTNSGSSVHPNSAYVAPAAVAEYAESAREAKKRVKARWKLAEAEFYEHECVCGVTHPELKGAKGTLLHTISAMMSTFGDADKSCVTTVEEVHYLGTSVFFPHKDGALRGAYWFCSCIDSHSW